MKKQYSATIHTYFSDYVKWLLSVSLLFVVSLVACVAFNGINKFFGFIPFSFIVIYLLSTPLLILYCRVKNDIKENNIEQITVKIFDISNDKNFNFQNKGGATIGKHKYRIIDENNNVYLVTTSNAKDLFMGFYPNPTFSLEIIVLRKSRLVLQMKIIENAKTIKESREQQDNIKHFKKIFNHYF